MTFHDVLVIANRSILKPVLFLGIKNCRAMATEELVSCDFEVFGTVQGVFFRKYTARKANNLGLKGWVTNTTAGTVKGQIEGPITQIDEMKKWLQVTGSPKSKIDKAVFTPSTPIKMPKFKSFEIIT